MLRRATALCALASILAVLLAACGAAPPAAAPSAAPAASGQEVAPAASNVNELTILWAEWDPANYLQQLVNEYEDVAGVKVNVVQEPWPSFGTRTFAEFAAKGQSYDMVVGDSQWLG